LKEGERLHLGKYTSSKDKQVRQAKKKHKERERVERKRKQEERSGQPATKVIGKVKSESKAKTLSLKPIGIHVVERRRLRARGKHTPEAAGHPRKQKIGGALKPKRSAVARLIREYLKQRNKKRPQSPAKANSPLKSDSTLGQEATKASRNSGVSKEHGKANALDKSTHVKKDGADSPSKVKKSAETKVSEGQSGATALSDQPEKTLANVKDQASEPHVKSEASEPSEAKAKKTDAGSTPSKPDHPPQKPGRH
jgi:hypothetical protein